MKDLRVNASPDRTEIPPAATRVGQRIKRDPQFWSLRRSGWRWGDGAADLLIDDASTITIGRHADASISLILARLAGEWVDLARRGAAHTLAGWAAARSAAQFADAERFILPPALAWLAEMAADRAPSIDRLAFIARTLAQYWPGSDPSFTSNDAAAIVALWPVVGSCEAMMETGGDIRLLRDPQTDLNGYGCSHRPRPWAVTFASSTASSVSERGYEAADRARVRLTAAMLQEGDRSSLEGDAARVRRAIGRAFRVPSGGAVVLAASGTDSELLALALCHLPASDRPITTILLAPEETGSGVPMAAVGRHFAVDTANGHDVSRAAPIEGFRPDTSLVSIPLRDAYGDVRGAALVEADIIQAIAAAIASGHHIVLHALDLSKTGLLAPSLALLRGLRAQYRDRLDIIVDACQLRVAPERLQAYLALDAIVQVTGSKFLTGPPFAGAALLSPAIAARLKSGTLPSGLNAYFSQGEFPHRTRAAEPLPAGTNYGLILRWRAALAEFRAFAAVENPIKTSVLEQFSATVLRAIERHPILALQPMPDLHRDGDGWDCRRTIFAFSVRDPAHADRWLDPAAMRRLYRWLNADCGALFDSAQERAIASRICHIGQPVALPDHQGGQTGWLRVSAGARLISGEPCHRGLPVARRIAREMSDLAMVFDKIALLHAHWQRIAATDPVARYQ
jgi:hypothetical protein